MNRRNGLTNNWRAEHGPFEPELYAAAWCLNSNTDYVFHYSDDSPLAEIKMKAKEENGNVEPRNEPEIGNRSVQVEDDPWVGSDIERTLCEKVSARGEGKNVTKRLDSRL
jgi:hypothetical protein